MGSQMLYSYGQTHKFLDDNFDKIMYGCGSSQYGKPSLNLLTQLAELNGIIEKQQKELNKKHLNELLEECKNTPLNKRVFFVTKERLKPCINTQCKQQ